MYKKVKILSKGIISPFVPGFPGDSDGKVSACNAGDRVWSIGWEDPRRRKWQPTLPFSSTLAWKIPWTEEPGGLQSMGSQSQTQLSDFTALCSIQTVLFAVSFYLFNYVACAFPFYSCPSSRVKILLEMFASSRILLTYTRLALLTRDDEISRQGL